MSVHYRNNWCIIYQIITNKNVKGLIWPSVLKYRIIFSKWYPLRLFYRHSGIVTNYLHRSRFDILCLQSFSPTSIASEKRILWTVLIFGVEIRMSKAVPVFFHVKSPVATLPKPSKLRESITPGTVLILLSGRFVTLAQLTRWWQYQEQRRLWS